MALPLVLVPVAELALLLYFCGSFFTLLSMFFGGLLGAFLAHRTGVRCWMEFNRQLDCGETPTVPTCNGILILLAAVLLILPGLLTSLCGLVLFFPLTRTFMISYMVLYFEAHQIQTRKKDASKPPDIIDV